MTKQRLWFFQHALEMGWELSGPNRQELARYLSEQIDRSDEPTERTDDEIDTESLMEYAETSVSDEKTK